MRLTGTLLLTGLAMAQPAPVPHASPATAALLQRVAEIHGAAGVFAVAGYRMGERALKELGESRGSFALDVTHRTPLEVQYSCMADGWQAATGVSVGKLNLHLVEAPAAQLETIIADKKTGKELVFRLRPEFLQRYLNLPTGQAVVKGREVAALSDEQIFTMQIKRGPSH